MNANYLPSHIFFSYSSSDIDFVIKIKDKLIEENISIWIDSENLIAGTPNWEKVIRKAISHAFVVISISSHFSKDSVYVQAELALAQNYGVPIIPIWIDGDSWIESTPMNLFKVQYIDFKNNDFDISMELLIKSLKIIIAHRKPKHFLVEDPFSSFYDNVHNSSLELNLSEYITIYLNLPPWKVESTERLREEKLVVFNPDRYNSFQELLDDLYIYYLQNTFTVSSYGNEWILKEKVTSFNPPILLVPFNWLREKRATSISICEPFWTERSLSTYGIVKNKKFFLVESNKNDYFEMTLKDSAFGIAVSNLELFNKILRENGKQPYPLYDMGYIEIEEFKNINYLDYKYVAVVEDIISSKKFASKVIIETKKIYKRENI